MLRAGGKLERVFEVENRVYVVEQVQHFHYFTFDLVRAAEDVGIILLELPHPREARERPMQLVSVQDSKVSHSVRQVLVGSLDESKHDAVAWAVHRLEPILLTFVLDPKDIFFILEIVPTHLPQLSTIDAGALHLMVASDLVLRPHQILESIQNDSAVRVEQSRPRGVCCEMEQILFLADGAVVSLTELFLFFKIAFEHRLFGERYSINPLQIIVLFFTQPVG